MARVAFLAVLLCATTGGTAAAARAKATVSFGDRALSVALWHPDSIPVVRGVLVITGGQASNDRSGDTRSIIESRYHQRFAESLGFALLGSEFRGSYTDASSGPGRALLDALAALAHKLKRPELAHAPLLLHGFSNGGYFGFSFAAWKPERVIAFCLNKSGFAKAPLEPALLATPGIFIYGELEIARGLPSVIAGLVREGRQKNALWAVMKEWGRGHEEGEVERVVAPFFVEMVAARYPPAATPLEAEVPLIALREERGWIGDHHDNSIDSELPIIEPFSAYAGDKAAVSWLPNEGIANLWRGFVTKQPVQLRSPGPNAQLKVAQPLQLTAAGVEAGRTVVFYDRASVLAPAAAVSGGRAKARWIADAPGVRGIVALVKADGEVKRTSRPVAVLLFGPPPKPVLQSTAAGR